MHAKEDAMDNQPRELLEIIGHAVAYVKPDSSVVFDEWAATKAVAWDELGMRYEFCVHSRRIVRSTHLKNKYHLLM